MDIDSKFKPLSTYLKNIPDGLLRTLIGQNICDAIVNYHVYLRNLEVDYVAILENKFGKNILFEKAIFQKLVTFLDDKIIKKIAEANSISFTTIDNARSKIASKGFGYKHVDFSKSIISILQIDQAYYLPERQVIDDSFETVINPLYTLHPYQKNLKDKVIQNLLNPNYTNRMLIHMPTQKVDIYPSPISHNKLNLFKSYIPNDLEQFSLLLGFKRIYHYLKCLLIFLL